MSHVTQYKAVKDRYFHLAAPSVPISFTFPAVLSLSSFLLLPRSTSFHPSGRPACRELRPVRGKRRLLVLDVDLSAGSHPTTHLFNHLLLPREKGSVTRAAQSIIPELSFKRGNGQCYALLGVCLQGSPFDFINLKKKGEL